MSKMDYAQITALIQREVIPAMGCTEPAAVALCVAKATETLGEQPQRVEVMLSANVLKNALGVGIPGTCMIGLPIAIALGALIGKSERQLEVLCDCTPESTARGQQFINEGRIDIQQKNTDHKLYIEATCVGQNGHRATAIIAGEHTNFVHIERDGQTLLHQEYTCSNTHNDSAPSLTLQAVYDYATTVPLDDIRFILATKQLNKAAAEHSFSNSCGHNLGYLLNHGAGDLMLGQTTFNRMVAYTAGACDARMAGAQIPVMSNSGSGNQGITATLPVVIYAEDNHNSEEELIRALALSHLTVIYIKQNLGRLSALCGCVVASTGSSCGITYLMGGKYAQIASAVQNMIANITGMICDGAKPSCALKVATGTSTAVLSAILAMNGKHVCGLEGIIDNDVDKSIRNMSRIGSESMLETDRLILQIMTNKQE